MELLPIFLNIKGRQCLIVGGGELAFRKAILLDKASASVKFVANEFSENIESPASKKNFPLIKDSFKDKYLEINDFCCGNYMYLNNSISLTNTSY